MDIINEKRTLTTVRLTSNQKKAMTRIVASATEKVAAEEVSKGRGLVAARDLLVKLGMIEYRDGYAALTTDGEQLLKDSNLIDDMGSLTEEGNKFAYEEGEEPMATESLIKQIHDTVTLKEALQRRSPEQQKAAAQEQLKVFSPADRKEIVAIAKDQKELDMESKLYDKLFNFFADEMPYGIQKARTGDPDVWIIDHLDGLVSKF